jgi:hypothetical protein
MLQERRRAVARVTVSPLPQGPRLELVTTAVEPGRVSVAGFGKVLSGV